MEDVVDEGNAGLDGIGPVLGGSGARNVCDRDKSFDPRFEGRFLVIGKTHITLFWVVDVSFI